MQFKLFDAVSGGTQIGSTLTNVPITATDGVFSTKLDFGANALSGANRWLEIAVRRNSGESYVTLSPREQIVSAPYSVRTLSAANADVATNALNLGGLSADQYVTTTNGGASFIRNQTTLQSASNFNISGDGFVGGNLGVGTTAPSFKLDVFGTFRAFRSGDSNDVVVQSAGPINSWARFWMITPGRAWVLGTSRNFNGDQFYLNDQSAVPAMQTRMTIQPDGGAISLPIGNLGVGTTAPNTRLTLSGGAPWTSNGWTASMNMQNASALGWEANASGQRFGIGQSGGGLYFFRTNSSFGNVENPAQYDMRITDSGNLTQPSDRHGLVKALLFVDGGGAILRCYNAVTGNAAPGCGFSVTSLGMGTYRVNVGFNLDGRFILVSSLFEGGVEGTAEARNNDPGSSMFVVDTTVDGNISNRSFKVAVF